MEEVPGPAVDKLQIFEPGGSRCKLKTRHAPLDKYFEALVTGNLKKLKALVDQYYEDVNVVFEISKNELEWQVKKKAAYGLSGTLDFKDHFQT